MEFNTTKDFIEAFVRGELGKVTKHGRWSKIWWGNMDVLCYTPSDINETEWVAYRLEDGSVLSNANQLTYVGRKFAWGSERSKWGTVQEPEQVWMENAGAVPIPFTLFKEAGMDVRDFSWVVKPIPENVTEIIPPQYQGDQPRSRRRHFSGACIFAIDKEHYLFDIDRHEIQAHNIFNPFLTKLPKPVKTIAEAYDVLMPDEVKKAISDGVEVQRQGEFFFIRHSDECPVAIVLTDEEKRILRNPPSRFGYGIGGNGRTTFTSEDRKPFDEDDDEVLDTQDKKDFQKAALKYKEVSEKFTNVTARPGELGKSATGSHTVEKYIKDGEIVYASGVIKQNRRQHGDLTLNGWYKVLANTGTLSWTIRGDID